mmetsp:Transcript_281/g.998  ORF Transcript_281/g.998 Transcript_281/m.998 type:complete len:230 (-) Transcript_281:3871-4560(-)
MGFTFFRKEPILFFFSLVFFVFFLSPFALRLLFGEGGGKSLCSRRRAWRRPFVSRSFSAFSRSSLKRASSSLVFCRSMRGLFHAPKSSRFFSNSEDSLTAFTCRCMSAKNCWKAASRSLLGTSAKRAKVPDLSSRRRSGSSTSSNALEGLVARGSVRRNLRTSWALSAAPSAKEWQQSSALLMIVWHISLLRSWMKLSWTKLPMARRAASMTLSWLERRRSSRTWRVKR